MPRFLQLCVLILVLFGLVSALQMALAQERENGPGVAAPPTKTAPPPAGATEVQKSSLDTYLLRDSKGNLVPIVDMTFEDFEQLMRLKRGLAPPAAPAYVLDSLSVTGVATEGIADLQATATIRLREASGWVQVPLLFPKAVLKQPSHYEGPGEHFLTYDPAQGGFQCWLKGADSQPHVIVLDLRAPLTGGGGTQSLPLALPPATESSLRLQVSAESIEAKLTSGNGIVSTSQQEGRSEISVLGATGDMALEWRKIDAATSDSAKAIEVSGEILVKVEGERMISAEAKLRVRSFGSPIDSFQIQLPPSMELVPGTTNGYTISPITSAENTKPTGSGGGQIVEVRFERPTTGILEAQIATRLNSSVAAAAPLMPGRFNVLGAVRQRGTIDFTVDGQWQLRWTEDRSVRRLDIGADPQSANVAARYEYSRQPCGLQLAVSSKPSRIGVEPTHVVHVDPGQLRIESTLKYRLRGSRVTELTADLGKWKLQRISPADLFEIPEPTGEGRLKLEAKTGTTLPSELELKLEAYQPHDPASATLSFDLPVLQGDIVSPATVIILPADNVELTPNIEQIAGLSPDSAQLSLRPADRQQPPLVFRDLGGGEPASFSGAIRVRTRRTTASARARIRLEQTQLLVEQRLDYRIAYERQRTLEFLVPRTILAAGPFEVFYDEKPITPNQVTSAPPSGDLTRFEVHLPEPQIGLCQLQIRYALPLPKPLNDQPLQLTIPLAIPADEPNQQLGGQQVEFIPSHHWRIEPDPTGSDEFSRPTPTVGEGGNPAFAWSRVNDVSRWLLEPIQAGDSGAITISKAWVQSWVAGGLRSERVAYRLRSDQPSLQLVLPDLPRPGSFAAAIDGRPISVKSSDLVKPRLDLPADANTRECIIEVWYIVAAPITNGGLHRELRPPIVDGASPPRRFYWELLLPQDEHLVLAPAALASEMDWSSKYGIPVRKIKLDQRQLETWIGATRQDELPQGSNRYVFSALGRSPVLSFAALHRRILILAASGAVLVLGLLLIHVPAIRRPEALLFVALLLVGSTVLYPDAAYVFSRSCLIGVGIVAGVAVWNWLLRGRVATEIPSSALRGDSAPRERSTIAPKTRSSRQPGMTTATAPAGALAEPEA